MTTNDKIGIIISEYQKDLEDQYLGVLAILDYEKSSKNEIFISNPNNKDKDWVSLPIVAIERILKISYKSHNEKIRPVVLVFFKKEFESIKNIVKKDFDIPYPQKTKRNKLSVYNKTHESKGRGRKLSLKFYGDDVHREPIYCAMDPGGKCSAKSRGIGNGNNIRNFNVFFTYYKKDGSEQAIGSFRHAVYAGPLSDGVKDKTWIYKKSISKTEYEIYRAFYTINDAYIEEPITKIKKSHWENW